MQTVQTVLQDFSAGSWTPVTVSFRDDFDDEIVVCFENGRKICTEYSEDDLDEIIFVLNQYNIPNRGYHERAQSQSKSSSLPKACKIIDRRHNLNKGITIKKNDCRFPRGIHLTFSHTN